MLGSGAIGHFALGQVQAVPVIVQFLYDGTEIARRKTKVQSKIFEAELQKPLKVRGAIYDSLHPPFEIRHLQYAKKSPTKYVMVRPQEKLVDMMLKARNAKRRREDGEPL